MHAHKKENKRTTSSQEVRTKPNNDNNYQLAYNTKSHTEIPTATIISSG